MTHSGDKGRTLISVLWGILSTSNINVKKMLLRPRVWWDFEYPTFLTPKSKLTVLSCGVCDERQQCSHFSLSLLPSTLANSSETKERWEPTRMGRKHLAHTVHLSSFTCPWKCIYKASLRLMTWQGVSMLIEHHPSRPYSTEHTEEPEVGFYTHRYPT